MPALRSRRARPSRAAAPSAKPPTPPVADTPSDKVPAGFFLKPDTAGPRVWSPIPGIDHASVDNGLRDTLIQWFHRVDKSSLDIPGYKVMAPGPVDVVAEHKTWLNLLVQRVQTSLSLFRESDLSSADILSCRYVVVLASSNYTELCARILHWQIYSALRLIGPNVPHPVDTSFKSLLVAYKGGFLVDRFATVGIVNRHTFAIMAGLRHRSRSFEDLLLLALGLQKGCSSAKCLELLMDREVVGMIAAYPHHSGEWFVGACSIAPSNHVDRNRACDFQR